MVFYLLVQFSPSTRTVSPVEVDKQSYDRKITVNIHLLATGYFPTFGDLTLHPIAVNIMTNI